MTGEMQSVRVQKFLLKMWQLLDTTGKYEQG